MPHLSKLLASCGNALALVVALNMATESNERMMGVTVCAVTSCMDRKMRETAQARTTRREMIIPITLVVYYIFKNIFIFL